MKKLIVLSMVTMLSISSVACGNTAEKNTDHTNSVQEKIIETDETKNNVVASDEVVESTGNILLDAELNVADVMNGLNTEKIGEYAYISVKKSEALELSMEEYDAFCINVVKDSGYNWVTIIFDDGTGLQFQGSLYTVATYGTLDNDDCIEESIGMVISTEESIYEYSEY